jgi:excisionase family DNA binding protein
VNFDELMASRAAVVTVGQAASLFGVDVRTVTRAIQCGELPVLRLGRRILIPRLRLLELLGVADPAGATDHETLPAGLGSHGVPNGAPRDTGR